MIKKTPPRIRVLRNNEIVDPSSTSIRTDQAEKLKKLGSLKIKRTSSDGPIKLNSKTAIPIYTSGKSIRCSSCSALNQSKRMYKYKSSSRGEVILCEKCDEDAEVRSFFCLDALDRFRKKVRVNGKTD